MLEVCFNESVKGSLIFAQPCADDAAGGAARFMTGPKEAVPEKYTKKPKALRGQAVPSGEGRQEIAGIFWGLSEGDIRSPLCLDDCPRKALIRSVPAFDGHHAKADTEAVIHDFWANCLNDLEKLKSNPPQIRVWLDCTPDAQCGLLFLADLLKGSRTEMHVVELPSQRAGEGHRPAEYRSWSEVAPQLYGTFLQHEKVLAEKAIGDLAARWELLKAENSPLRVVKNGLVTSAEISYYDDFIRREFPKDTCTAAHIIGRALGRQKIPTGDAFIADRIKAFIRSGELKIVSGENGEFYQTVVKRET